MKYKLVNRQTSEEHLCDKVTIDGYDYYVSDEIQLGANNVWVATNSRVFKFELHMAVIKSNMPRIIIATNNPNIDIPKVVDEVEKLSKDYFNLEYAWIKDKQEPYSDNDIKLIKNNFKSGYNKSQETHPFSEEDMIEFYDWCDTSEVAANFWRRNRIDPTMDNSHLVKLKDKRKELLQLWEEQRIKIVYYNE